jgi:hypothetical protein
VASFSSQSSIPFNAEEEFAAEGSRQHGHHEEEEEEEEDDEDEDMDYKFRGLKRRHDESEARKSVQGVLEVARGFLPDDDDDDGSSGIGFAGAGSDSAEGQGGADDSHGLPSYRMIMSEEEGADNDSSARPGEPVDDWAFDTALYIVQGVGHWL